MNFIKVALISLTLMTTSQTLVAKPLLSENTPEVSIAARRYRTRVSYPRRSLAPTYRTTTPVRGYYRRNGTYVNGYSRRTR